MASPIEEAKPGHSCLVQPTNRQLDAVAPTAAGAVAAATAQHRQKLCLLGIGRVWHKILLYVSIRKEDEDEDK